MIERALIEEWTKRLRSGDYAQGKELLCRVAVETCEADQATHGETVPVAPTYCCLGVLGEILAEAVLVRGWEDDYCRHYSPLDEEEDDDSDDTYLSDEWLPLDVQQTLASANDGGKSFAQIADMIEAQVLPLAKQ